MTASIPVVDVYAGCGGLGEGFNLLEWNGQFHFDVRLHIEKEAAPIRTLQLRAFYHQFRNGRLPDSYYQYVGDEIDRDELFKRHPEEADEAIRRCLRIDLGRDAEQSLINSSVAYAIGNTRDWVLIGGPPCQAYSVIGRARNHNRPLEDYDPDNDVRFELYREYVNIIAKHQPAVFVLENVRGLLSASRNNQSIFDRMVGDLKSPADSCEYSIYSISRDPSRLDNEPQSTDYVVRLENYGIPQARHRVIILGVRNDIGVKPGVLKAKPGRIAASAVLADLPAVRSGLSSQDAPQNWMRAINQIVDQSWWNDIEHGVQKRIKSALSNLSPKDRNRGGLRFLGKATTCEYLPDWYNDERLPGTLNHEARTHRKDDLWRYLYAACYTEGIDRPFRISDFPTGLQPNHRSIETALRNGSFADRFSVVPQNAPSRTVVNHIRKDGHYYIHYDPSQCRSLTVREAARLQTFPDNYFFEGSRTDQYGQVGNAVPPLLSYQIAEIVADLLVRAGNRRNGQPDA